MINITIIIAIANQGSSEHSYHSYKSPWYNNSIENLDFNYMKVLLSTSLNLESDI